MWRSEEIQSLCNAGFKSMNSIIRMPRNGVAYQNTSITASFSVCKCCINPKINYASLERLLRSGYSPRNQFWLKRINSDQFVLQTDVKCSRQGWIAEPQPIKSAFRMSHFINKNFASQRSCEFWIPKSEPWKINGGLESEPRFQMTILDRGIIQNYSQHCVLTFCHIAFQLCFNDTASQNCQICNFPQW